MRTEAVAAVDRPPRREKKGERCPAHFDDSAEMSCCDSLTVAGEKFSCCMQMIITIIMVMIADHCFATLFGEYTFIGNWRQAIEAMSKKVIT